MKKKKFPTTIIMIILIVVTVFVGKKVIDFKTIDYSETVTKGLADYYVNGVITHLDPIVSILDEYEEETEIRNEIQVYSGEIVGSWVTYLDSKYMCDYFNLNSCKAQVAEFQSLLAKIDNLYMKKSSDGFTIITSSLYNNLKSQIEKKIKDINVVISSPSARNPQNSEEVRLKKCVASVECSDCRDGLCKCYYVDENMNREEIICKKDIQN